MRHEKQAFLLRQPPKLMELMNKAAKAMNVSLNEWCGHILEKNLKIQTSDIDIIFREFKNKHILGIIQFGSTVRGHHTSHSDVDLLLVLESGQSIDRELYREWERVMTALAIKVPYSPQFVSLVHDPSLVGSLWYEVAMEGVVLLDPSQRVHLFLSELRYWMLSSKLSRQTSHGHPYWVKHL